MLEILREAKLSLDEKKEGRGSQQIAADGQNNNKQLAVSSFRMPLLLSW